MFLGKKQDRFSIRKLTVGVASLLIGGIVLAGSASTLLPALSPTIVQAASVTGLQGNVSSESDIRTKIAANEEVILSSDITITNEIVIPSSYTGRIRGNGYTLRLGSAVAMFAIEGATVDFDSITLDGAQLGKLIIASDNARVTLTDAVVQNGRTIAGRTNNNGGAIYALNSTIVLDATELNENRAIMHAGSDALKIPNGGALYGLNSNVTIRNSTINNNALEQGNGNGGAVHVDGGTLTISGSEFSGNHTAAIVSRANEGGAVFATAATVRISDTTFNTAKTFNTGGAVAIRDSNTEITGSRFNIHGLGDAYGISGGSIMVSNGTTVINDTVFDETGTPNKVIHAGGFISVVGNGTFDINRSAFQSDGAGSMATYGGAISFERGGMVSTITDTTFNKTMSDAYGGAIGVGTSYDKNQSTVNLTLRNANINETFTWGAGGGVAVGSGATLLVDNSLITGAKTGWHSYGYGGGIYNKGTTTITGGSQITGGTARLFGGGVYNDGVLTIDNAIVSGNTAQNNDKAGEYAGENVYAKKDVTITPNATFDEKDVRVLDGESAIILTGPLTQPINVSISEATSASESPYRKVGYTVAKGDGIYQPTAKEAQLLHYYSKETANISAKDDHEGLGMWDYVLNSDNQTVVLGQRVKTVYDANTGSFGSETEKSAITTVYKSDFVPATLSDVPTKPNHEFLGFFTVATETGGVAFAPTAASFGATGGEITQPLNPSVVTGYARWNRLAYTVSYRFTGSHNLSTGGTIELPEEVKNRAVGKTAAFNNATVVTANAAVTDINNVAFTPIDTASYTDAVNDGVWTFQSWDEQTKTINGADVEFVGTWTFAENKYKVTHEFVVDTTTTNLQLPQEIKDRLPADQLDKVNGATVTPTTITSTDRTYIDTVNHGTWTFKGWDKQTDTVNKSNVKFIGVWSFKEDEKYGVTYSYSKADGVTRDLPTEISDPSTPGDYNVADG